MLNLSTEKMVAIVLIIGAVFLVTLFVSNVAIDYIANKVIQKLEKDYSPSPYGPGLNPDRVNVTRFHRVNE